MERHLSGGQGRLCNTAGGMTTVQSEPQMVLEWRAGDKVEAGMPTGEVIPQVQAIVFPEVPLFLMGIVQKRLSSLSCLSQASSPHPVPCLLLCPCFPLLLSWQVSANNEANASWFLRRKTFPPVTLWLPNPLHYHTLNGAWGSSSGLSQENKILRVLFFPFLLKIVSLIASRLCL